MTLTLTELQTEITKTYKDLTLQDWKDKSDLRGITKRSQKDFNNLIPMYVRKISELRERLSGEWDFSCKVSDDGKTLNSDTEIFDSVMQKMDDWHYANTKEKRLFDKFAACVKEVEMRKDGDIIRTDLHLADVKYIDFDGGDDTNGGDAFGDAWKTLNKYTTETVRTPEDVAYVRAGTTLSQSERDAVDITFDENGDKDNYVSIIGCDSVTNDPWSDGSDVKPIVDFEDNAYQFYFLSDHYWYLERLDIRQSNDSSGEVQINTATYNYFKGCVFRDSNSATGEGVYLIAFAVNNTFEDCSWVDTKGTSLSLASGSNARLIDCSIDAGGNDPPEYGIDCTGGSCVVMEDTSIATANAFTTAAIRVRYGSVVTMRNTDWGTETYSVATGGKIYSEDNDATFEEHIYRTDSGVITRGTASPRAGGADSYAIMVPNAACGVNTPLLLGDNLSGAFKIWVTKDIEINISVWARVGTAWDVAINSAADCYIQASYLSNAANADRTLTSTSTETLGNAADWTTGVHELTTGAFTPLQTGWVYIWFYLTETDGVDYTEEIWVDIKPVVN